jgi:hypothetical protein
MRAADVVIAGDLPGPQRPAGIEHPCKTTVYISGCITGVCTIRAHLVGCTHKPAGKGVALPVLAPSGRQTTEGETMARPNRSFAVAVFAAAVLGVGATGAFAGEVKGPPGSTTDPVQSTDFTAARSNSNSNCSYSGLNDMDPAPPNQLTSIVQTPHDAPPGAPGGGACAGGTNENRTK